MPSNPAPGDLELVRAFVNTNDIDAAKDEIDNPEDLARWLENHGLLEHGAVPDEAARRHAVALREALRGLMLCNNDGLAPDPGAVDALNDIAARARLVVRFNGAGAAQLTPASSGVDAALGRILALVYAAYEGGTWPRLKACRNDTCHWGFYDRSKNRSGHWCSMSNCGSQLKARAYRQRRKAGRGTGTADTG
jgi:predicted RNA-binding Zn ribbon-like protein